MPFLADFLWRVLRADDAPDSVFLAGWPEAGDLDERLLAEISELKRVVELGRQARAAEGLKMRQPIRRVHVYGATSAHKYEGELLDELRTKEIDFETRPLVRFTYKPNLPVLGPRLGKDLPKVRAALASQEFDSLSDGRIVAAGYELSPDELIIERAEERGWAHDDYLSVGVDTQLDDELILEGRVLDLIHRVNTLRKESGLELTDRITLTLPQADADLLQHEQWIKDEVLATEIRTDSVAEPVIAKV
jgi:isoleucyl-tRNA synthetase